MANDLQVDIRSNIERVKAQFSAVTSGIEEKAIARALNRAGDQAITEAKRRMREVYNVKLSPLTRQIRVRRRAAPSGGLTFTVRFFSKRVPLMEFGARQTAKGVTVMVKKGGGQKLIPHAFIARLRSGHTGVFVRSFGASGSNPGEVGYFRHGKGARLVRWPLKDLPISELFSLDVPTMFLEKRVRKAAVDVARDSFVRNFEQQLKFLRGASNGG